MAASCRRPRWKFTAPGRCRRVGRCIHPVRGRCDGCCGRCWPASHRGTVVKAPSLVFTPSPMRVVFRGPARIPPTARAAISTTSSIGRRPLGNPAMSPTRNPRRFCCPPGSAGCRCSGAQVSDRARVFRAASRADRGHVLHQRQQVEPVALEEPECRGWRIPSPIADRGRSWRTVVILGLNPC